MGSNWNQWKSRFHKNLWQKCHEIAIGIIHLVHTQNFPKFCVSRGKKCEFFGTFCERTQWMISYYHWVKSVRIWNFFVPYFPAFGLNTERYHVSLRIQSEWMRENTDQKNSEYEHFSRKWTCSIIPVGNK